MSENVRTDGNSEVKVAVGEEYVALEIEVIELEEDVITSSCTDETCQSESTCTIDTCSMYPM
ncbi:MAG: hypothetical protein Q4C09_00795 [Atopobiaceae bacterium]|nr:hypothetical protein [Atopobiaceae bacterium]